MKLDLENLRWEITEEEVAALKAEFPRANMRFELTDMIRWCADAGKRGRKKKWKKFVTNWLRRVERSAIYKGPTSRKPSGPAPRAGQYEETINVRVV